MPLVFKAAKITLLLHCAEPLGSKYLIGVKFLFPSIKYCTDNGAMIALAGIERFERKKFNKLNFKPRPRWPLDKNAVFMKGKRADGA